MRGACAAALALLLAAAVPPLASGQNVGQVLANMFNGNAESITRGAGNLWTSLTAANDPVGTLPGCSKTGVLLNAGGFPSGWASLTAEQQALHPVNLVAMQLAYAVYQPPSQFKACLAAMGVTDTYAVEADVQEYQTTRVAHVFKAGRERVFVVLKGSSSSDFTINAACRHERPDPKLFGTPRDVRLHRGFWRSFQVLEGGVTNALRSYLKDVPSGEVYVVGHSLGAAAAAIAALRLSTLLGGGAIAGAPGGSRPRVAGVWLLACPRAGNAEWARAYDEALQSRTLRMSNFEDFAVRMPAQQQACSVGGASLEAATAPFTFAHVGRSLLMCPDTSSGLTWWRLSPGGSESVSCGASDEVDASGATHQLGSYFDAWRRAYLNYKGSNLADSPQVRAVMCQECTYRASTRLEQIGVPARPGGPVTCAADNSCRVQRAFQAATAVGGQFSTKFDASSTCRAFMCDSQQ